LEVDPVEEAMLKFAVFLMMVESEDGRNPDGD
jgi:hypothetical protein